MEKFFILLITLGCLTAENNAAYSLGRDFDTKTHDINQIELQITNYGQFGPAWWPKGSSHNYIYGAGLWFGTIDSLTNDTLVTIGYGPHGGECECVPGLKGMLISDTTAIIYMYPSPWPAPAAIFPMAPQARISHQDSWCCFNDCDSTYHVPGDTRPIGIEYYQTIYAWDIPELEDVIFLTYTAKNVSEHKLEDCYIGIAADCDIGNEAGGANDQMAGIVGKWYVVDGESIWVDNLAYQCQEETEPGWSEFTGVIGFDLLGTPEQLGMTALKRFTLDVEPLTDPERYLTLAGYNFQTGVYAPYDTAPSPPEDQRFLLASGPFDLAIDSSVTMVFAIFFAYWKDIFEAPDTALVLVDKWAQYQYDNDWMLSVEETMQLKPGSPLMTLVPNPVAKNTKISFSLPKSGSVSMKLYNTLGQLVKEVFSGYKPAGNYTVHLNTSELAQGTYLLMCDTPAGKISRSLVVLH